MKAPCTDFVECLPGHRWEAVRVQVHEQQRQPKGKEQDRVEHDTQRDEENKGVRERVLAERCILKRHASLFFSLSLT
jgi:hypothetical protein